MFRKTMLAALIAVGTLGGVIFTAAPASAQPPWGYDRNDRDRHDHDHDNDRARYRVLVAHHGHWDLHRVYRDRDDAQRAVRQLERRGLDARIERVRSR